MTIASVSEAATAPKSRLTTTRMATMRRCPRQHHYRFELGLSRIRESTPLRLGAAFHKGLADHNGGAKPWVAIRTATAGYEVLPAWVDAVDWAVERETVRQLLAGHFWRYDQEHLEFLAVEREFEVPLVNPKTGAASRTFVLAGKIDAIVRLPDGRIAVLEYKTTADDVSPASDFWLYHRCDPQISLYLLAARAIGYDVATIICDATRKPTIRLRKDETSEGFSDRLRTDIGDRPDHYYQRCEIPRLEANLAEFQQELWQQADLIRESRNRNRWFRNAGPMTCRLCEFSGICLQCLSIDPDNPPAGYERLSNPHPELTESDQA